MRFSYVNEQEGLRGYLFDTAQAGKIVRDQVSSIIRRCLGYQRWSGADVSEEYKAEMHGHVQEALTKTARER